MESKFRKRDRARELRVMQTTAEERLWNVVRGRQIAGQKFRRQHPITGFIVDFVCLEHHLIIEIDGDVHTTQQAYDSERDSILEQHGFRIVRIPNDHIHDQLASVVKQIQALLTTEQRRSS